MATSPQPMCATLLPKCSLSLTAVKDHTLISRSKDLMATDSATDRHDAKRVQLAVMSADGTYSLGKNACAPRL